MVSICVATLFSGIVAFSIMYFQQGNLIVDLFHFLNEKFLADLWDESSGEAFAISISSWKNMLKNLTPFLRKGKSFPELS